MDQRFDDELRRRAIQSNIRIPDSYGRNVDRILRSLLEKDRKVMRISKIRRPVAAILACCFLFGSVGVYATVNYVNVRLHDMDGTEIRDYQEDVQNTPVNYDTYSREFTEDEKERIDKLRTEYATEGKFPASELLQVEQAEERQADKLVFVVSESTFYLPDRELTDEECLEWIDFHYKRDYSLGQSAEMQIAAELGRQNVVSIGQETEESVHYISEEEAHARAVTYAKDIIGLDVSQADYKIERINSNSKNLDELFLFRFNSQGNDICEITVNVNGGKLNAIRNMQIQLSDESLNDVSCINENYQIIKDMLCNSLLCDVEIESGYVEYYENLQDKKIKNGAITYVIELENKSGYSISYSIKEKAVIAVFYISECGNQRKLTKDKDSVEEVEDYRRKEIILEN